MAAIFACWMIPPVLLILSVYHFSIGLRSPCELFFGGLGGFGIPDIFSFTFYPISWSIIIENPDHPSASALFFS